MPCQFFACVKGVLGTPARDYREADPAVHSKFSTPLGANHVKNDEGGVFSLQLFFFTCRLFYFSNVVYLQFFVNFSCGF